MTRVLSSLPTAGVSATAKQVAEAVARDQQRLRESIMIGLDSAVFDELAAVFEECSQSNWDGHGALPVDRDTLRAAYCFLEALPLGTRAPTVSAEPDGHLALEWHQSLRRTLSVSISPDGELHYAALLGPNRAYGTEAFLGDVPNTILDLIQRVYAA